jgi:enoyl-CoA hydratase
VAAAAPLAVWASREIVLAADWADDDTLKTMSNTGIAKVMASEDTKEGLQAFIEKRPPVWRGR